jgi:hypothetical protein
MGGRSCVDREQRAGWLDSSESGQIDLGTLNRCRPFTTAAGVYDSFGDVTILGAVIVLCRTRNAILCEMGETRTGELFEESLESEGEDGCCWMVVVLLRMRDTSARPTSSNQIRLVEQQQQQRLFPTNGIEPSDCWKVPGVWARFSFGHTHTVASRAR